MGLGPGGLHVTLITSNVANGWKFPELEDSVREVERSHHNLIQSQSRSQIPKRKAQSRKNRKAKEKS